MRRALGAAGIALIAIVATGLLVKGGGVLRAAVPPSPPSGTYSAFHFRDGPPAAVTGGFGEDSCHACHFDGDSNASPGAFLLEGVPQRFTPGKAYRLRVSLTRPGMAVAGFQLAARFERDGLQAGSLAAEPQGDEAAERPRVGVIEHRGIQYIQHTLDGILPISPDTARWTILWTAPRTGAERVRFHAAAVAGDDDESQVGDHVYTAEAVAASALSEP